MSPSDHNIDINALAKGIQQEVARAGNLVESLREEDACTIKQLLSTLGKMARPDRHVIGISGPPGVGKSSMISKLIHLYRADNKTIGVISVDPSSLRTCGALLGDRVRIEYDFNDPGVFIRSMSAGTCLGGLARHTGRVLTIFEAVYDVILLETVGVGQSEADIEHAADTVVVMVQPGSGDMLQFIKAGIMEIPHILVVGKADLKKRSARTFHDLQNAVYLEGHNKGQWQTKIIMASAIKDFGIKKLKKLAGTHFKFLNGEDIETIRRKKSHHRSLTAFKEEFGNHGVNALGGQDRIMGLLNRADISSSWAGEALLARHIKKTMTISTR